MEKLSMDFLYRKEVLDTKHCDVCGNDYEVYNVYMKGEFKHKVDYCDHCAEIEAEKKREKEWLEIRNKERQSRYDRVSTEPFELKSVTFDDYIAENEAQKHALQVSKMFANDELEKTTLFFQGDTGLGKTHLSYCIYKEFKKNKVPSIFIDMPSLLSKIRSSYGKPDSSSFQSDLLHDIKNCDLLVLDDIGAEYVKPDANGYESWAADIIFQISNGRQGKKNIYTTNFTSKLLTQKYGMMSKRIISRLMSNAKIIKVEGDDHRLKGLE